MKTTTSSPIHNSTKERKTLGFFLKTVSCIALVAFGLALGGCPQPQQSSADAEALRAENARLKAEAEARTKAQTDNAVAQSQAAADRAAADAQSAAQAQAQTAADVAKAEAEVAKAQAEADEAAKAAAAAQTSYVSAQGEADKAKEVVEQAKVDAEESKKAAEAPTATEADVAKAEADANQLAIEVAKAEAARAKAELERAKASAAATKIRAPISSGVSDFLLALSTAIFNPRGGIVYPIGPGRGALVVPPGAPTGPGSTPFFMFQPPITSGVLGTVGGVPGAKVLGMAQLTPAGARFAPPVEVWIDLTTRETPGTRLLVQETNNLGLLVPRVPDTWADVDASGWVALAYLDHFCTIAVTKPDPSVKPPPAPASLPTPPPWKEEVIAKAKSEAAAELARNKQLVESYKAAANDARVAMVTRVEQEKKTAAKELADQKADAAAEKKKAAAEKKIADLKKRKEKALAEKRAIENQNRQAAAQAAAKRKAQEEKNRKAGEAIGSFLRGLGENAERNQQQEQQRRQQQQQQQQQQPNPNLSDDQ